MDQHWDCEVVYDEEIAPLMEQIIAICKEHQLPMVASFQYRKNEEGGDFCTTRIPRDGEDDRFHAAAGLLLKGFFAYSVIRRRGEPDAE